MKLEILLPEVIKRFKKIDLSLVHFHAQIVSKSESSQYFETRVTMDCLRRVFRPHEICKWYDEYQCNDKHISTLAKKAFKIAFKDRYNLKEMKMI